MPFYCIQLLRSPFLYRFQVSNINRCRHKHTATVSIRNDTLNLIARYQHFSRCWHSNPHMHRRQFDRCNNTHFGDNTVSVQSRICFRNFWIWTIDGAPMMSATIAATDPINIVTYPIDLRFHRLTSGSTTNAAPDIRRNTRSWRWIRPLYTRHWICPFVSRNHVSCFSI